MATATVKHSHHHHRAVRPAHIRSPHTSTRHRSTHRPPPSAAIGGRGTAALRFALAQLGKPYEYGGSGPAAYDCSGLAQQAWRAAGVQIPRTTEEQAAFGSPIPTGRIQPGDLVVFYADASHVGIYTGHGTVVVAPHPGAVITIQPVSWMPVYDIRRPG